MVSRKPEFDYTVGFLHALLDDISIANGKNNTTKDKTTVAWRFEKEGFSFLSRTLPALGAAVDAALRTGRFVCPSNFRRYKTSALPSFMKGLLRRIFALDGTLLKDIDFSAISEVRQVCFAFYKTKVTFTPSQIEKAISKFKETDASCYTEATHPLSFETKTVIRLAQEFLRDLFAKFNPYNITPSHGPGIVASGEKPHEKRIFSTYYRGISNEYRYNRYFYVNPSHVISDYPTIGSLKYKEIGINKVLFVPKDSRGPRTIACEPLEYMWIQQGLRKELYDHIEQHALTSGRINFTNQSINQRLAESASRVEDGYITLDLKDASDLVSNDLVKLLFLKTGPLLNCLQALRTDKSILPNGEIVILKKYAAMGSALCFPVEALVFYSILVGVSALFDEELPPNYVYGDDIITARPMLEPLVRVFTELGLVINQSKSCYTGFFRESCGAEYYAGRDVTYLKVREIGIDNTEQLASAVELSNSLFDRAYYSAARYVEKAVKKLFPSIPFGEKEQGYLCFFSNRQTQATQSGKLRWNNQLHRYERRLPVLAGVRYQASMVSGIEVYAEYLRKITSGWSKNFVPGSYAKRAVELKQRWVPVTS